MLLTVLMGIMFYKGLVFTDKPVSHNLLHAFCHLFDSLEFFIKSKVF